MIELSLFAFSIKKEVCGVLDFFLSFLKSYEKKNSQHAFIDVRSKIKNFSFGGFILFAMNKACQLLKNMICF
jgi:hypothetical protein